jgi:hypothetical protein
VYALESNISKRKEFENLIFISFSGFSGPLDRSAPGRAKKIALDWRKSPLVCIEKQRLINAHYENSAR